MFNLSAKRVLLQSSRTRHLAIIATPTPPKLWTKQEIKAIYNLPLLHLIRKASDVHVANQKEDEVQLCTLLNIKEGGCTEDCSYCSQSSKYKTDSDVQKLMKMDNVLEKKWILEVVDCILTLSLSTSFSPIYPILAFYIFLTYFTKARQAKANGSTRFCMGAAWRDMKGRKTNLKNILEMVTEIRGMGMEVCTTLGMVNEAQAKELKEAALGLTAYNHNIDTSREFYPSVITTRSFDERLATIDHVRNAGIKVCSGGILGLGETEEDHISFLHTISQINPESLPINALVPIPGTPLGDMKKIGIHPILRTIATARILLPLAIIRLAAGRISLGEAEQAMAFMAGANAIFTGERMLTTDCTGWEEDKAMLGRWGLKGMQSFREEKSQTTCGSTQDKVDAQEESKVVV